jgi:hypothetical protein
MDNLPGISIRLTLMKHPTGSKSAKPVLFYRPTGARVGTLSIRSSSKPLEGASGRFIQEQGQGSDKTETVENNRQNTVESDFAAF